MLDKEILRKLAEEQQLTAAETLRLDEALDSDGHAVHELLDSLEDVAPSYAWRSSLNQRLAATRKPKAHRLKLVFGWAGGLTAVAATVLAVMIVQQPTKSQPVTEPGSLARNTTTSSLEEALVSSHMQGAAQSTVGSVPVQDPDDQVFDWSKLDKS